MTERFTDEELAKLPKWAQSRIGAMSHDLEYLRNKLVKTTEGDTEVFVHDYQRGDIPLPPGSTIVFKMNGAEVTASVREGYDHRDRLFLMASGGSSRWLAAESGASNTMTIANLDLRKLKDE